MGEKLHVNKNRNGGFTPLELLIAGGMAFVVIAGVSVPIISQIQQRKQTESYFWLGQIRSEVIVALKNKISFKLAVTNPANPSLQCLVPKVTGSGNSLNCSNSGGAISLLQDAQSKTLINTTSANSGFNKNGEPCNQYSDSSVDCPFRFEVSWEPICSTAGTCFNPDIKFEGKLLVSKSLPGPINPALYSFKWILPTAEKADVVCVTSGLGGVQGSGTCKLKIDAKCSPGQYLTGFQSDGTPMCQVLASNACPNGQVLQGFDGTGTVSCGGQCLPQP